MTDEQFERWIAALLRGGVMTAAAITLAGGVANLLNKGHVMTAYHRFHSEPAQYTNAAAILAGASHLDWLAVIQLGLLVLIATPVARVVLAIIGFALERDWTYVAIASVVLGILLYSLI